MFYGCIFESLLDPFEERGASIVCLFVERGGNCSQDSYFLCVEWGLLFPVAEWEGFLFLSFGLRTYL